MLSRNPYSRALALAPALVLTAGLAGAAEEHANTFQPFVKGDIFVASTIMDHPTDDHMGTGRIFQYDAQ
ncbi:MAG: hypothetical protein F4013_03235 [Gammaproteobacteria bacterium]|nr:hypothetical protein [Gammaproteobacteria bacterium]